MTITEDEAYERFLGKSLATLIDILETEFNVHANEEFLEGIRTNLYARFRTELKAMPGIGATIDALGVPCCVASSSQVERIRLSLSVTGLLPKLPNIFSASMVKRGKPAPDLFLYAADQMLVEPRDCIVIEDSPAGIAAPKAAGMTDFAFSGGSHANAMMAATCSLVNVLGPPGRASSRRSLMTRALSSRGSCSKALRSSCWSNQRLRQLRTLVG